MGEQAFPKFNVASEWIAESGLLCVQLVEIVENPARRMLDGYGVRVILPSPGEASFAFITNLGLAEELRDSLANAIEIHRTLTGGKK